MGDPQGENLDQVSTRFEQKLREIDKAAQEPEARGRVCRATAWNLQNAGTYVRQRKEALVIGHRPGIFHFAVALVAMAVMSVPIWLVGMEAPWIAMPFAVLTLAPFLALTNTRRFEIARGVVRARGRALGFAIHQDWVLGPGSAVRVEGVLEPVEEGMRWMRYQAQILVSDGWMGVAEVLHDEKRVREFAEKLAAAAGVPVMAARESKAA